ncbi:MAG: sensor histidine kinase [Gemmiger sp.]
MDGYDEQQNFARQEQLLRGGLHGRFAQSFCVLQTTLDAMQSALREQASPALQNSMRPLLEEMRRRLPVLERLADQAADIAMGGALRELHKMQPVELVSTLRMFCDCVSEELVKRESQASIVLEEAGLPAVMAIQGDGGLIGAILSNLLSNSLRSRPDVQIRLQLTPDRRLRYEDNGPGLPEPAWKLLVQNELAGDLLRGGGTGLLLVREYAACLGWQPAREGKALVFVLPQAEDVPLELRSTQAKDLLFGERCRAHVCRELDALELNAAGQ